MKREVTTENRSPKRGNAILGAIHRLWENAFDTTPVPRLGTTTFEQNYSQEKKSDKEMILEAIERRYTTWEKYAELNLKKCAEYAPDEFLKFPDAFLKSCAAKQNISEKDLEALVKTARETIANVASRKSSEMSFGR